MSTDTLSLLFALLAVLCLATVVAVAGLALAARAGSVTAEGLLDDLRTAALPLAAVVAVVTTAGSLYYSEVAGYVPCELCWFQRICAYPLAVILPIAAIRRDAGIRTYALPLAGIGAAISIYHRWIQAFPDRSSAFCTLEAPCSAQWVDELGFVTIPTMAMSAFALVITMMLLLARRPLGAAPERELQEVET